MNAHHDVVQFTLPECAGGSMWSLLIDTNSPNASGLFKFGDEYTLTDRSFLLLEMIQDA
jgi:isoamylase